MSNDLNIGYAVSSSSTSNGYLGAVLITDQKGFPVEFQYTDPISPTKIQQVLYGQGLEKYIKVDVVLESLLNVLSNRIDILLVQDEDLLRYSSDNLKIIRVSSTKSSAIGEQGKFSKVKECEYLVQTSSLNSPIRVQMQKGFTEEAPEFDQIIELLTEAGHYIDICEPLNRVYKAIELICNQEA